jgi:hypothetical protein
MTRRCARAGGANVGALLKPARFRLAVFLLAVFRACFHRLITLGGFAALIVALVALLRLIIAALLALLPALRRVGLRVGHTLCLVDRADDAEIMFGVLVIGFAICWYFS